MALEFAKQGCNLALCARRKEHLEALQEQINKLNPGVQVFVRILDVTKADDVFAVFSAFREDFKSIGETLDRVIVNAGMGKGAPIGKGYAKANMQTAVTNFCGALNQFEAALEIFRAQNQGHLVAISSMSAFRGYAGAMTVYAATKAGLASLAEGVRVDLLNKPIKVSTVFPGFIQSEMTEGINKKLPFIIDLDKGSKLLVKAINRERHHAYVPKWPWRFFRMIFPLLSLRTLRKF